jgi:hypothetical protein
MAKQGREKGLREEGLSRVGAADDGPVDAIVSSLATRQHGIVCRRQLLDRGLTTRQIRSRTDRRGLLRLRPGTYAVGHRALTVHSHWMAAVLYAGPDAVLSYGSAAALFGVVAPVHGIDVTRTGGSLEAPGLTVHSSRSLCQEDRTSMRGIPVTSPARTLIDLAGTETARALDDKLSAAWRLGLLDCAAVKAGLERVPNRKGAGQLRRLLKLYEMTGKRSRSELETRFLRLCFDAGLPMPEPDAQVGRYRADLLWREQRLIAEIDSRGFHAHRFEEDRIRDIDNLTAGYRTIRVTYRMLETAPGQLVASVRTLLGRSRTRTPSRATIRAPDPPSSRSM